jgi:hypothetical protein
MTQAPTLEAVAARLGGTPEALTMLRYSSRLIGSRLKGAAVIDEREDRVLIRDVERLQHRLAVAARLYAGVEAEFGREAPTCFEDADNILQEVINFLEEHLPERKGRHPDSRRLICARVCLKLWPVPQPYSPTLWEVCELYWQACGNPTTGEALENWRRYLLQARGAA